MTKPINPFSSEYVSQIKLKPTKYKRPVLNQPPVNARASLVTAQDVSDSDRYFKLKRAEI